MVYVLIGHYVQTCLILPGHQAHLVGHYNYTIKIHYDQKKLAL